MLGEPFLVLLMREWAIFPFQKNGVRLLWYYLAGMGGLCILPGLPVHCLTLFYVVNRQVRFSNQKLK